MAYGYVYEEIVLRWRYFGGNAGRQPMIHETVIRLNTSPEDQDAPQLRALIQWALERYLAENQGKPINPPDLG